MSQNVISAVVEDSSPKTVVRFCSALCNLKFINASVLLLIINFVIRFVVHNYVDHAMT